MFKFADDQGHLVYFRSVRGRFNVGSGQAPIPGPRALAGWQYSVECICVRSTYVLHPRLSVAGLIISRLGSYSWWGILLSSDLLKIYGRFYHWTEIFRYGPLPEISSADPLS